MGCYFYLTEKPSEQRFFAFDGVLLSVIPPAVSFKLSCGAQTLITMHLWSLSQDVPDSLLVVLKKINQQNVNRDFEVFTYS